jgi:hypothetical protein
VRIQWFRWWCKPPAVNFARFRRLKPCYPAPRVGHLQMPLAPSITPTLCITGRPLRKWELFLFVWATAFTSAKQAENRDSAASDLSPRPGSPS